ncbi:ABC transporter ATP-binding protein [Actinospongicola halichondriae]|uniref:ABC transporter ATP-binding protein n=1 Tax=Actinospongicola halichondriae TaxID=3236844 RepID=UPI003D3C78D9
MSLTADRSGPDQADTAPLDVDAPPTQYEPAPPTAYYAPPSGRIHPDSSLGWIRRMQPVVMGHKRSFLIAMSMAAVALFSNVAIPAVVGSGIDEIRSDGDRVSTWVIALLVLAVLRAVFTFGYRSRLYKFAYAIEFDLRSLMFRHLATMSHGFYDKVQTGQLVSRANSDIRAVQMLLAFAPFMSMMMMTFVLAFAFMLTKHVLLTLVAVSTLPLVYVFGVKLRNQMFPLSWIVQGRLAEVATTVEENVTGVRVVKAFAGEEHQIDQLAEQARRLRWSAVKVNDARAKYAPLMENLPRLGMALTLLYGGYLAIDGQVTVGTIITFSSYVLLLQAPFRMLGFFMIMSQRAAASAGRIFEILDTDAEIVDRPGAVDLVDPEGRVDFDLVRFRYDDEDDEGSDDGRDVLDRFDLHVEAGETVAIVGGTGSGKSTVARLLLRFYDVNDGAVRIDGRDVRDLTMTSIRHHVGMVTDEPFLFSASIADNIAYARPGATRDEVVAAARAANAHGFISDLDDGYDAVVGERGYTLSGGQRQRVAIARTLLADPAILILDDATSAVDVRVEAEIHEAIERLAEHRTTIVIAHRLSTIALADRVALVEGGRVLAFDTHERLLADEPHYREVLATAVDEPAAEDAAATDPASGDTEGAL